ncbi:MAG: hypothetical protein ACRD4C_15305 [Candidatus Acidiferrales bacterium]
MSRSRFEKALLILFVLTLPFIHARVRGDGIGYYAYLRSPLIDHNLRFATDWKDPSQELLSVYLNGHIYPNPITKTGHLPNFYTVGPAILWSPFVVAAHLAVLAADHLGFRIAPDGHSWPYIDALSGATALYGFLGLYFSFNLAKNYVEEKWAFWATLGIWFASSLPVYMYLDPSWSHALSAFCVSWFLWYWHRTHVGRTRKQWLALGFLSGLMIDVFPGNSFFILAPVLECIPEYREAWRILSREPQHLRKNLQLHSTFVAGAFVAILPTLIARQIVFGNPFSVGIYGDVPWNWRFPAFRAVLFSASHGLFVYTPILLLAVIGLLALWRTAPQLGIACVLIAGGFYSLISFYPWWGGAFSFGNRFFVSLTPIFVLGLAATFSWMARFWADSKMAARRIVPITVLFILWNLGLVYQWSTDLMPNRGQVYWSEVLYNQFRVVPQQILSDLSAKVRPHL